MHLGAQLTNCMVLQKLKELASAPTRGLQGTVVAEQSATSNSSHSSGGGHGYTGTAQRFSVAGAALGGVHVTQVHPKNPKVFQHERPTNSSSFRAITRTAQAGGFSNAQQSMTSESVGPGSYSSSMHRCGAFVVDRHDYSSAATFTFKCITRKFYMREGKRETSKSTIEYRTSDMHAAQPVENVHIDVAANRSRLQGWGIRKACAFCQ